MIPLALGAAISPLVFLGGIAVMTGPSPLRRGAAFALGVLLPLIALAILCLLLGRAISLPEASNETKGWIDIALGTILVLLGCMTLLRPAKPRARPVHPEGEGMSRFIAMGAGLMVSNVTTIALLVPAMKLIAESTVDEVEKLIAVALAIAVTMTLVLVPLAVVAVAPTTSERLLTRAGDWLETHRRIVAAIVCFGFGAFLLIKGFVAL